MPLTHEQLIEKYTDLYERMGELREDVHFLEEMLKQYANPKNWEGTVDFNWQFNSEYDDPWELADRAVDPGKYV